MSDTTDVFQRLQVAFMETGTRLAEVREREWTRMKPAFTQLAAWGVRAEAALRAAPGPVDRERPAGSDS
ncbi:hypothetical protein [Myxococcus xanthus]|uniref:Uncharacterized protein n=1 Tax=Myxococcus xanthus TaxID=34 RepID=A0A7Y4IQF6_MYXXA|nr:hypothetical protein [Myxococcus xanthus]NOJ83453.1 hypothetical protein [Myxococcus xanthus]NOJ91006.1 hypothetical protein [Myxococcus xanthus]